MRGTQATPEFHPPSGAIGSRLGPRRRVRGRLALIAAGIVAASFVIEAVTPQSQSGDVQLQLGSEFYAEGRYRDALDAFQRALKAVGPDDVRTARSGVVQSALR